MFQENVVYLELSTELHFIVVDSVDKSLPEEDSINFNLELVHHVLIMYSRQTWKFFHTITKADRRALDEL